jgi:hypothetical protein
MIGSLTPKHGHSKADELARTKRRSPERSGAVDPEAERAPQVAMPPSSPTTKGEVAPERIRRLAGFDALEQECTHLSKRPKLFDDQRFAVAGLSPARLRPLHLAEMAAALKSSKNFSSVSIRRAGYR